MYPLGTLAPRWPGNTVHRGDLPASLRGIRLGGGTEIGSTWDAPTRIDSEEKLYTENLPTVVEMDGRT